MTAFHMHPASQLDFPLHPDACAPACAGAREDKLPRAINQVGYDTRVATVRILADGRRSLADIARLVGISQETVRRLARREKIVLLSDEEIRAQARAKIAERNAARLAAAKEAIPARRRGIDLPRWIEPWQVEDYVRTAKLYGEEKAAAEARAAKREAAGDRRASGYSRQGASR